MQKKCQSVYHTTQGPTWSSYTLPSSGFMFCPFTTHCERAPTGLLFLEGTFCLRTFACAVSSQTTFLWYLWITPFLLQIFAKDFCHLLCYLDRLLQISSHWFSLPTFTQYYFFLNTHCFLSHYRIYLHIIFYLSLSFRI